MGGIFSSRAHWWFDEEGEMSSPRSPAADVLEDDDLLSEILLRLPPQPSSLPRASLVCTRWRRLLSDPAFSRRFRCHHRRSTPLLGFFHSDSDGQHFAHTLDAPDRVPPRRFSLQLDDDDDDDELMPLGCRHGLVLFFDASRKKVLVWDPVTGDQHRVAVPAGFCMVVGLWSFEKTIVHGTVLRADEDILHFQVILAVTDDKDKQQSRAVACVYSSTTGLWGNLVSTPIPSDTQLTNRPFIVATGKPARLVGNSLYWLLAGNFFGLLEFDLERQNLTVIPVPVDVSSAGENWDFTVVQAEGGDLGFFFLSNFTAQLWKRMTNGDGVASWVLGTTIELDKLLSLNSQEERGHLWILGYAEDNNMVFMRTITGLFLINLESLQFKKLSKDYLISCYHPFESVYAAGI